MTTLVVPIARENYDRKDEQNFRELVRRNLEKGSVTNVVSEDIQAQIDALQSQIDILHTQVIALNVVMVVHAATINEVDFIFHAPAPPTTGPHARGERVFNSLPSIGQPKGWVCTVGGTPGTWETLELLGAEEYISLVLQALYDQVSWISQDSGPPTTGLHTRGEKVNNSLPAVGQPKGWICTVTGTPGTWVSEGNL